jgi:hypothetical protein
MSSMENAYAEADLQGCPPLDEGTEDSAHALED